MAIPALGNTQTPEIQEESLPKTSIGWVGGVGDLLADIVCVRVIQI